MSSVAADWTGVLINFCNLAVNVLRLLGEEPVRRWFRQRSARPTTGSGDTEMGQRGDFDEVLHLSTLPNDTPAGDALFAWTRFNKIGNRERYMNCAGKRRPSRNSG
ncbi:hypothetical protein TRIATDRAFT_85794 [Trichoderma atroviride IMI 206040]|uniref:Uncharacterized protein n=1 Tax=Hypocrea atroviridis (strain ATCC 20476 / IMI 206040) TaxID=452589 RepID=G9P1W5_HYPAI|nr:uncharacterized protein TRIATDRAFT_85794 [Trichoderma atroviride IMI 206040]EHK43392.1 hypothetical protein TRIATDRAFT_85794 [Trichoderma atroviride IMI 206040]